MHQLGSLVNSLFALAHVWTFFDGCDVWQLGGFFDVMTVRGSTRAPSTESVAAWFSSRIYYKEDLATAKFQASLCIDICLDLTLRWSWCLPIQKFEQNVHTQELLLVEPGRLFYWGTVRGIDDRLFEWNSGVASPELVITIDSWYSYWCCWETEDWKRCLLQSSARAQAIERSAVREE